jgi:predicted O-methyltransferase YrrM
VAKAVRDAHRPASTGDERIWIQRIESRRDELSRSERAIDSYRHETVGEFTRSSCKSALWCRFIFRLLRTAEPESAVEMGSAVGISGAYHAAALALNGHGSLVTLEGAPDRAGLAKESFRELGLDNVEVVTGMFEDTLVGALEDAAPVDFVFVDGNHREEATVRYFDLIYPALRHPSLVLFDDIRWSEGMTRAWIRISRDPRVAVAVDLGTLGACLVDGSTSGPAYHTVRMPSRTS